MSEVVVKERQRELSQVHVERLWASFEHLGAQLQLQPIVLDEHLVLIDGAHRLAAAKQAGWQHISAVILAVPNPAHHALLELEANRVRLNLNPVELEAAWRLHYEPQYRAMARSRQLAGLRRGSAAPAVPAEPDQRRAPLGSPTTLAAAAKQVTGLSLPTLTKIADVRRWSTSPAERADVRAAAAIALNNIAESRTSITAVHRDLRRLRQRLDHAESDPRADCYLAELAIERVFQQALNLSRRLEPDNDRDLEVLASLSGARQQLVSATRVALTRALANVVAIECRFESDYRAALRRIGAEVSRLQSRVTTERLGLGRPDSAGTRVQ